MNRKLIFRLVALAAVAAAGSFGETISAPEALDRYLQSYHNACRVGDQSMAIEIQASLPKLKKEGSMQGLKVISASGQVAYRFLRFTGDKLIKTDVIARFLTAESQPPERLGNIGTTLENYKFHYQRVADYQGTKAYVFQLRPRKKRAGLFKGELWLEANSAVPLHEAGELVKSPSIFIQRIKFVRDYADNATEHGSCGTPQRTSIMVQTRLVGDAEMVVWQRPVPGTWQPADVERTVQPTSDNGQ